MDKPTWDGSIVGWTNKHIGQNQWRVNRTHEQEDLLQDAYFVFHKCIERYVTKYEEYNNPPAKSDAHFMSLYMRAWTNKFTDMTRYERKVRKNITFSGYGITGSEDDSVSSSILDYIPPSHLNNSTPLDQIPGFQESSSLTIKLKEASGEIRSVLSLMMDAPSELMELALDTWKEKGRLKPMQNAHICECLGFDKSKVNVVQMLEDYFLES
jgi:hypothetical protein